MTIIRFQDADGTPLDGATVVITAAPGEMTDIGYLTAADGSLTLTVPEPGHYAFTLMTADGRSRQADAHLATGGEVDITAA